MGELVDLLNAVPSWVTIPLVVLTFLVVLNKMADGKPGAYVASWIDRKLEAQDKRYNAVHAMLRENIEEQAREYRELNDDIKRMTQSLGEGQASLAVKNSEIRQLIRGMNIHLTRQHEQTEVIIRKLDVLSEKVDNFTTIFMNIERRIKDG